MEKNDLALGIDFGTATGSNDFVRQEFFVQFPRPTSVHRSAITPQTSLSTAGYAPAFPHSRASAGRTIRLFGVEVHDTTLAEAARWLMRRVLFRQPASVAFLNAHCVNMLNRDAAYAKALQGFDRIFADGAGMRLAARAEGIALADNVNGTDLFPVLCDVAARAEVSLFLLGGREGIAATAAERMCRIIPGLEIAGTAPAYFASVEEEDRLISLVNSSGARVLLVGMGVPLQELWIARNRHRLRAEVVIGVGGLFDYYSGRIARAPYLFRRFGLECAWRLALEPRRLARRYLLGNAEFLMRLAVQRLIASRPD